MRVFSNFTYTWSKNIIHFFWIGTVIVEGMPRMMKNLVQKFSLNNIGKI